MNQQIDQPKVKRILDALSLRSPTGKCVSAFVKDVSRIYASSVECPSNDHWTATFPLLCEWHQSNQSANISARKPINLSRMYSNGYFFFYASQIHICHSLVGCHQISPAIESHWVIEYSHSRDSRWFSTEDKSISLRRINRANNGSIHSGSVHNDQPGQQSTWKMVFVSSRFFDLAAYLLASVFQENV